MRWLFAILFLMASIGATSAQSRPQGYADAERAFTQFTVDERIKLQVLLTANGYWPAVPNVNLSNRLFEAIQQFQRETGRSPTGVIDEDQVKQLLNNALPLLQTWNFRSISHPTRGHPIWVPLGLGLTAERTAAGTLWKDPLQRTSLGYSHFPRTSLEANYRRTAYEIVSEGGQIHFKVNKPDFFVISYSTANGLDGYMRYHQDGDGILGFLLLWKNSEYSLHMERVATLVSGSFWASMTGAPFTEPPTMTAPPREAVAVARPSEPIAPPSAIPASPQGPKEEPEKKGSSSGTGFFVSQDGHILTNAHVVDNCSSIGVKTENGDMASGRVLAQDKANDLALLKVSLKPSKVAAFRIGIRLGEGVAAFGYPLNTLLSSSGNFTLGNVTALSGLRDDSRYLQVSAPVQPGNSGGPLFDQNGNVVGVVSAKLNALNVMLATNGDIPQNVNFAIKGTIALSFLESNRVTIDQGTATQTVPPADIADQAKLMSVLIRCE
ncbi:serine protease [Microvirga rosea]|uniref:serine protease n=1 Tax=Microvirga rosea TaxID=2715425 RepID=UPI001D0A5910|nr:serine protease [Microvirga rosea]MCB8819549.1 serine protease [Microvirga rosea]